MKVRVVDVYLNHKRDVKLGTFLINEDVADSLLQCINLGAVKLGSAVYGDRDPKDISCLESLSILIAPNASEEKNEIL